MNARHSIPFLVLLGLLGGSPAADDLAASPAVTVHPRLETAGFAERWSWGESELRGAGWVGYTVDMWAEPGQHFLSGSLTIRGSGGVRMKGEPLDQLLGEAAAAGSGAREPLNPERPGHVRRPIAVLVALERGGAVADVDVSDLGFPVDLEGRPLAWIGPASGEESFRLLAGLWSRARQADAKEEVIEAVGLHDRAEAVDFLARVVDSRAEEAVREEAAEALAEQGSPRAVEVLRRVAEGDPSLSVREEAVEALGESRAPGAQEVLFDLARHGGDVRVRAEAVEALAEKAAERVIGTLEDVVYQDESATVREEALEALGELPGGEGLAVLVKVAKTHPDAYMREEALDVLVDLGERDARARKALRMMGSG